MSEECNEFRPENSDGESLSAEAGTEDIVDFGLSLFGLEPAAKSKDSKNGADTAGETKPEGGLLPNLRKATCPAVLISGVGLGGLFGSRTGPSWLDPASPWLITFAALACFLRGLVHVVGQDKLTAYPPAMRFLTVANLPVSILWAIAATVAICRPTSPLLPVILSIACVTLAVLATLQGIVVIKLREGTFKNAPAYPDIALGTDKVASLEILHLDVTVGELVSRARQLSLMVRVGARQAVSALVAVLLIIGGLLIGHELRTDVRPTPTPVATQPAPTSPAPTPTSVLPTPRSTEPLVPAAPSTSTAEPQYDDLCLARGVEPGTGAPNWARDKLNDAWFGPGGQVAGCAQLAHTVTDAACPSAWEEGVGANGDIVSVAIADECHPDGAIYLGYSAAVVRELLADGHALSGSCRRRVAAGDVQLVYGSFGTISLVRPTGLDDANMMTMPPAATAGWAEMIGRHGMVWPQQMSSTTWRFVDESGNDLDASVHVTFTEGDSRLAEAGILTDRGVKHPVHSGEQDLAVLTPGASPTCH